MALSPETRILLQQALKIRNSSVPLHRVIDILATENGDVSEAVNRFRDIRNEDLRRAFHFCALLLRELEAEAGLRPAWETQQTKTGPGSGQQGQSPTGSPSGSAPSSAAASPRAEPVKKPRFRPEELVPFEDESARGTAQMVKIYVDGASKGNPGEAGIGVAMFTMDGRKIAQIAQSIGIATNNIAEYTALIEALKLADRMGARNAFVLSDSQLMVYQMTGRYKIKNSDILKKVQEAKALTKKFDKFSINYIGREHNTLADALSTSTLPKKKKAPPAGAAEGEQHEDILPPIEESPDEGATD